MLKSSLQLRLQLRKFQKVLECHKTARTQRKKKSPQIDWILFTIFPLSSPLAHSEMSGFGWTFRPPPKKKDNTSLIDTLLLKDNTTLSEPKVNSEER